MFLLRVVVLLLVGLLGTAAQAATPTPIPSPALVQIAQCDTASLILNPVNGKPMTLKQARRIPIGAVFTVPVADNHVTRVLRAGDNPWTLCREELVRHAQSTLHSAVTRSATTETLSRVKTAKPAVRLGNVAQSAPSAFAFDAAPLLPVRQEELPPPPAATPHAQSKATPLVASPQEGIPAPTVHPAPQVVGKDATLFSSPMPREGADNGDFWSNWTSDDFRKAAVLLAALLLSCLIWTLCTSRRKVSEEPQSKPITQSSGGAGTVPQPKAEGRAAIPQGTIAVSFRLELPEQPYVPFTATAQVVHTIITEFTPDNTQCQVCAIEGHGPWCDGLSRQDAGPLIRIATYNLTRNTFTEECAALALQIRAATVSSNTEPTKLHKAIRAWLEASGIDWKRIETTSGREKILFPARHHRVEAA